MDQYWWAIAIPVLVLLGGAGWWLMKSARDKGEKGMGPGNADSDAKYL